MPRTARRSRSSTRPPVGRWRRAPLGGREDVDRAVEAARRAFDDPQGWSSWSASKRGRTLAKLSALVKANLEELARLESRNVGKPISGARGEALGASLVFEYYAGAANKVFGETIPVSKPGLDFTLREPIGVVGLIVPWNFPMLMASWKLGPALAAGNTCILKPASWTPLSAIRLGELALEAGFPPGVVNVVTGPGGTAGAAIAGHPGIGKVAFTGETTTGQEIMRLAAGNVKKVSLELGGKSPTSCSPTPTSSGSRASRPTRSSTTAARTAAPGAGSSSSARSTIGWSSCSSRRPAGSRLATRPTTRPRWGRWSTPASGSACSTTSGSGATRAPSCSRVARSRPIPALAGGVYLEPTVFGGVSNDMRIAREEIFGPVVSIIPFDTEEEAVRLANATPYGLSGSIWSRDIGRALRTAKAVQAGVLSVNSNSSVHTEAPFGGYKMSGIGRELGMHAVELYTETKNVFVELG